MKKYIYFLFAAALLVLTAGCSKDDEGKKNIPSDIVGEWHHIIRKTKCSADFKRNDHF